MGGRQGGFTMVELIVVVVLLGIVAIMALPKLGDMNDYRALSFRDRLAAELRYAQKTATSHRRVVCIKFISASMTMTLSVATASGSGMACTALLPLPDGSSGVTSPNVGSVTLVGMPAVTYVQPDGRFTRDLAGTTNASLSLSVNGLPLSVEGSTGYVN